MRLKEFSYFLTPSQWKCPTQISGLSNLVSFTTPQLPPGFRPAGGSSSGHKVSIYSVLWPSFPLEWQLRSQSYLTITHCAWLMPPSGCWEREGLREFVGVTVRVFCGAFLLIPFVNVLYEWTNHLAENLRLPMLLNSFSWSISQVGCLFVVVLEIFIWLGNAEYTSKKRTLTILKFFLNFKSHFSW